MVRRTWQVGMALVAVVALGSGCGDGTVPVAVDGPTATTDPVVPSETSSPFTVGSVPGRYSVAAVGRGDAEGSWGEDCCGTDEPFTVLSPDGTPTHPGRVVVAATGYAGYQGGLEQATSGYTTDAEPLEVHGEEAFFTPGRDGAPSELVVARGDDLAVVVTAVAPQEDLVAVARATEVVDDRASAPVIDAPPAGLRVVGSASVDAVLARYPFVHADPPGPPSAHAVSWTVGPTDDGDALLVQTLPGTAGDSAALAAPSDPVDGVTGVEERTIDGRPAFVVEWAQYETPARSVWLDSAWGDLVVVTASGEALPSADELVAIAASVRPTDAERWDAAVATGTAP